MIFGFPPRNIIFSNLQVGSLLLTVELYTGCIAEERLQKEWKFKHLALTALCSIARLELPPRAQAKMLHKMAYGKQSVHCKALQI